jgi:aconitate hydratase
VFRGDSRWNQIAAPEGGRYSWDDSLDLHQESAVLRRHAHADRQDHRHPWRALPRIVRRLDHDRPHFARRRHQGDLAAGQFLQAHGVVKADFNSYGSRRGNDDVMVRGTFANIRIKNLMFGGEEGGNTLHFTLGKSGDGVKLPIYDAAMMYKKENVPLIVIAGKEYGTGSSRDWAAKGTMLLGVKAVIAESFERIHRSNLVGMGILPMQFAAGQNAQSLGLKGDEVFDIAGLNDGAAREVEIVAKGSDGEKRFKVKVLLLTPKETEYYRHGGILPYVCVSCGKREGGVT